jgi:hypothetical protein
VVFGIGTNLTNDLGYEALQIVLKLIRCGATEFTMRPVAKISNDSGKGMCESELYLSQLSLAIERTTSSMRSYIVFEPNEILNFIDFNFYSGIPSGIEFEFKPNKDTCSLIAPGYGGVPYGNGSILVRTKALEEHKCNYRIYRR